MSILPARSFLLAAPSLLLLAAVLPAQNGPQAPNDPQALTKARSGHGPAPAPAARSARGFRKLQVPGEEVARNVERLTSELRWHRSLSSALAAGRSAGKPVVWIQALGDIDGFL